MHHFNWKSLAFYGGAISSVLLLFKLVTDYGESNLKAPLPINSRYRLVFKENLPTCEESNALMLNIEQSGIYLNGFLQPANPNTKISTATELISSLTGRLSNQQLNLSGKVPKSILCNIPSVQKQVNIVNQNNSSSLVKIQIQLMEKGDLIGKMNLSGASSVSLTAIPQKAESME